MVSTTWLPSASTAVATVTLSGVAAASALAVPTTVSAIAAVAASVPSRA